MKIYPIWRARFRHDRDKPIRRKGVKARGWLSLFAESELLLLLLPVGEDLRSEDFSRHDDLVLNVDNSGFDYPKNNRTEMHLIILLFKAIDMSQNEIGPPSIIQDVPWIRATPNKETQFLKKKRDYILGGMKIEGQKGLILKETKEGKSVEEFPLTEESIDLIAKKNSIRSGKWLVFRDRSEIDEIWDSIAQETRRGSLGVAAKVSTKFQQKQQHVICVYTDDYFDSEEIARVRERLRELGIQEQIYYKPDIYTHLGIYSGTCSIRPWKYKS